MERVKIKSIPQMISVSQEGCRLLSGETISAIQEIFSCVGLNVRVVSHDHPIHIQPRCDGNIHLFLNASCKEQRLEERLPLSLWGFPLQASQRKSCLPTGGEVICYEDVALAEIVEGFHVYILFDLFSGDVNVANQILKEILIQAMLFIYPDGIKELEASTISLEQFLNEEMKDEVLSHLKESYCTHYLTETKKYLSGHRISLDDLQKEKEKVQEKERQVSLLVQRTQGDLSSDLELLGQEFENLFFAPNILDVTFREDEVLEVYTDTLYCTDPRTNILHEIGRFKIVFDKKQIREDNHKEVLWFNQTQKVRAWDERLMMAPHVFSDGHACLGNMEKAFADLLSNREYFAAMLMAIKFIESVNVSDIAGKCINHWPQASLPVSPPQQRTYDGLSELDRQQYQKMKKLYIQVTSQKFLREQEDIKKQLVNAEKLLNKLKTNYVSLTKQSFVQEHKDNLVQLFSSKFDALLSLPQVHRIAPTETGFEVFTKELQFVYQGRQLNRGRFRISIYGENFTISHIIGEQTLFGINNLSFEPVVLPDTEELKVLQSKISQLFLHYEHDRIIKLLWKYLQLSINK
ncbi:MAG: hypothetical protein LBD11_07885 [Candidatus Peribacteria bacterium]|jgi:hypothetical protein|nr:hypothetical protein [Candidatus Peribacteria bacterium]